MTSLICKKSSCPQKGMEMPVQEAFKDSQIQCGGCGTVLQKAAE